MTASAATTPTAPATSAIQDDEPGGHQAKADMDRVTRTPTRPAIFGANREQRDDDGGHGEERRRGLQR